MGRTTAVVVAATTIAVVAGAGVWGWTATRPPAVDLDALAVEPLPAYPGTVLGEALTITDPGCPAFTVRAPVPGPPPAQVQAAITIEPGHAFTHACLGTADVPLADRLPVSEDGARPFVLTRVPSPAGELVRVEGGPLADRLTDWHVEHDGYVYAFGYLRPAGDARHRELVEAMLATISWDAAAG